ncbi:MAG: helix-turn-helix domain-containing protein [Maricaulaceae bacterium]
MDQINVRGARLAYIVDQHVGERIRQRRTLLGFTQEQLAEALDISYQQIQKYETGSNRVSAGRLFQIARRLEVEVGYFFDGLETVGPNRSMPHGGSNRAVIELVRNFNDITDAIMRASVANLVKTLAERCACPPASDAEISSSANGAGSNGAGSNGHGAGAQS